MFGSYSEWRDAQPLPDEFFEKQAEMYAKAAIILKKYSEHIDAVSFEVCDYGAWMGYSNAGIFDYEWKPKLAYYAVANPEAYLAGGVDAVLAAFAGEPFSDDTSDAVIETPVEPAPDAIITDDNYNSEPSFFSGSGIWIIIGIAGVGIITSVVMIIRKHH